MNATKARLYLGTSGQAFQASGHSRVFVDWLDQNRNTISRQRCGQLGFYARKLLDLLGAEVAEHVGHDPEALVARLREVDLGRVGLANTHRSHLNRAARALHAWLNDLDPAATAAVMDRSPGRPRAATGTSHGGDGNTRTDSTSQTAATDGHDEDDDTMMDPAMIAAEMPEPYRFFEDTVCSQVSLAFQYDETVPDIRTLGRQVLAQHTATTRRRIAFDLASMHDVSIDLRDVAHASMTDLCDEAILSMLERRGVEIRDVPLQAA